MHENKEMILNKILMVCLVTVFSRYFMFLKTIFYFETKKLVCQLKMDRKQKLFSKLKL